MGGLSNCTVMTANSLPVLGTYYFTTFGGCGILLHYRELAGDLAAHPSTLGQHYCLPCYFGPNTQAIKAEVGDGRDSAVSGIAAKENGASAEEAGEADPAKSAEATDAMEDEEDEEPGAAMMPIKGPLPPLEGKWASCVRLLDPIEGATVECLELSEYPPLLLVFVNPFGF